MEMAWQTKEGGWGAFNKKKSEYNEMPFKEEGWKYPLRR